MQTNYARYLGLVGNDWALAEQNPAYRTSVNAPTWGILFITIYKSEHIKPAVGGIFLHDLALGGIKR